MYREELVDSLCCSHPCPEIGLIRACSWQGLVVFGFEIDQYFTFQPAVVEQMFNSEFFFQAIAD